MSEPLTPESEALRETLLSLTAELGARPDVEQLVIRNLLADELSAIERAAAERAREQHIYDFFFSPDFRGAFIDRYVRRDQDTIANADFLLTNLWETYVGRLPEDKQALYQGIRYPWLVRHSEVDGEG